MGGVSSMCRSKTLISRETTGKSALSKKIHLNNTKDMLMNDGLSSIYNKEDEVLIPTFKKVETEYDSIINSQCVDGLWLPDNDTNGVIESILKMYSDFIEEVSKLYSSIGIKFVITTVIVHYLYKTYPDAQEEYFLMSNKAKKKLKESGIDYNELISLRDK